MTEARECQAHSAKSGLVWTSISDLEKGEGDQDGAMGEVHVVKGREVAFGFNRKSMKISVQANHVSSELALQKLF